MNEYVAPPDKYFYTVDKKVLTNLYQLVLYLKECSNESFNYHVNSQKNDFYNWVKNVFNLNISDKLLNVKDKVEFSNIIKNFLEEDTMLDKDKNGSMYDNNGNKDNSKDGSKYNSSDNQNSVNEQSGASGGGKNLDSVSSDNNNSRVEKFHEFSDEELEKFTKFSSKEKEVIFDEKVDYLKTEYNEIRNMIRDLRKSGKDLLIADLLLRVVEPKISYYAQSKNPDDYKKVINIMNDIKREIEYASQQTEVTLADEIIKQLELQSLTLKKDFEPKRQSNILGKIFKKSNQEVNI